MSFSPRVAFAFSAQAIALKAKCGRVTMRDQIMFLENALMHVAGDDAAREAALRFTATVGQYPQAAGEDLQSFLDNWIPEIAPRRPEEVLAGIEAEKGQEFDWQKRVDING